MTAQATLERYVDHESKRLANRAYDVHDYRCGWLEKRLKEFFLGQYQGRGYGPKGARDELRKATAAGQKSLIISFDQLLEFSMELARHLIDHPRGFFSCANRVLEEITGEPGMHLHVKNLFDALGQSVKIRKLRAEHIGKFVQVEGCVVSKSESCFYLQDVGWIGNIISLDAPLRVDSGWRSSYPLKCVIGCGGFEADGCVRLGNYVIVTGILFVEQGDPDPLFRDVSTIGQVGYVFSKFLEVSHVGALKVVPWATWWKSLSPRSRSYRTREGRLVLDTIRRLGSQSDRTQEFVTSLALEERDHHWFSLVESGEKTVEIRKELPWIHRLGRPLQAGDVVRFMKGYNPRNGVVFRKIVRIVESDPSHVTDIVLASAHVDRAWLSRYAGGCRVFLLILGGTDHDV